MELSGRFLVLILAAVLSTHAFAATHTVGGSQGWDETTDFDSWASAQTFKVGDELDFKYTVGLHSVSELPNESAYKSCDIGVALNTLGGGSNKVKLSKPGTRYFACGTSGHCEQGMKVKITTVAAGGSPSSSTGTTTPSSAGGSTSASSITLSLSFFALIASLVASFALFM